MGAAKGGDRGVMRNDTAIMPSVFALFFFAACFATFLRFG